MAMVHIKRLTRFAALAFLMALVHPAAAETAIHFTLNRHVDGTATPFFLAIDKGYFKAEGLDVTIDAATGGSAEAIKRVAAGGYDMGVSDINLLIKDRDGNGTPTKAVFMVFDRPCYAIIARKSRGIGTPKDLEGKKLGTSVDSQATAAWPIFAQVNGIDVGKVMIEDVGLPVREPMLAAGEIDAATGCSFEVYVDLQDCGVPPEDLVLLPYADHGVVLYGDAIVASPNFAAEKPEAVRAFLRAYVAALRDTVRDPALAIESALRRGDDLKKNVELQRLRMAIRDNILTPAVATRGYGGIDPDRFAEAVNQLANVYRFKAKEKAAEAFDPSFLPPTAERKVSEGALR
jgi:NitT/TauT family transport system substrate-binding protein